MGYGRFNQRVTPGLTESIWQYEHEYTANIHKVGPVVQVLFMALGDGGGGGSLSARKTQFICPDSVGGSSDCEEVGRKCTENFLCFFFNKTKNSE